MSASSTWPLPKHLGQVTVEGVGRRLNSRDRNFMQVKYKKIARKLTGRRGKPIPLRLSSLIPFAFSAVALLATIQR